MTICYEPFEVCSVTLPNHVRASTVHSKLSSLVNCLLIRFMLRLVPVPILVRRLACSQV